MKILVLSALLLAAAGNCRADTSYLPDQPGAWKYLDQNGAADWHGDRYYKMNPEETKAYRAASARLAAYFSARPGARKPVGVNLTAKARAEYAGRDHAGAPAERLKPQLFIQFCPLFLKAGKPEAFCDEVAYLDVRANDARAAFEPGMNVDFISDAAARGRMLEMFYEPAVQRDLGGGVKLYDGYYDNAVVVARPGRPWSVPVTTREFIARARAYYQAAAKEDESHKMVLDGINAEIAKVPAALLDKPAYLTSELDDRPLLGICAKEDPGARALRVFNPAYFDPALPRTAVQLLTLTIPGKLDGEPAEGETDSLRLMDYLNSLKGEDLLKLLDVK